MATTNNPSPRLSGSDDRAAPRPPFSATPADAAGIDCRHLLKGVTERSAAVFCGGVCAQSELFATRRPTRRPGPGRRRRDVLQHWQPGEPLAGIRDVEQIQNREYLGLKDAAGQPYRRNVFRQPIRTPISAAGGSGAADFNLRPQPRHRACRRWAQVSDVCERPGEWCLELEARAREEAADIEKTCAPTCSPCDDRPGHGDCHRAGTGRWQ